MKERPDHSPTHTIDDSGVESGGWRFPPTTQYGETGRRLYIPNMAITLMFDVFRDYSTAKVEAGLFFYGERTENGAATVRGVVVPRQSNRWGSYHVDADAMAAVASATRSYGWLNLAQLHSHPGLEVEHSPYDDQQANSRQALSFVFPRYGGSRHNWLNNAGVHEWQDGYWHLLSAAHARSRVLSVNGDARLIDLRSS